MKKEFFLGKIIICIILAVFVLCRKEGMSTRNLTITQHTGPGGECSHVRCVQILMDGKVIDTVCTRYADPQEKLPKSSVCYKCLRDENPPSNPSDDPPIDKTPTYQFNAVFPDTINYKYGSDLALGSAKISAYLSERRINYFSIKEGGAIKIIVTISSERRKMFSALNLKIKRNNISFDSTMFKDSIPLFNAAAQPDTVDTITLYGLSRTFSECPVTLTGVNRSGVESDLICPGTCDEEIAFLCYSEKVIDSLRVYRINNPAFNPPDSTFIKKFNTIIKQSVLRVASLSKKNYSETDWDNNGNGILDVFTSSNNVPKERLEHKNLLDSIEKIDGTNVSCTCSTVAQQVPKIMILPGSLRLNYLLISDVDSGSKKIVLNTTKRISQFTKLKIMPWNSNSPYEEVEVNTVNGDSITIFYSFKKRHSKGDICIPVGTQIGGVTILSCAWIMDTSEYTIFVHEFLHMFKIGPLSHTTEDSSNVMFPSSLGRTRLRYRKLTTDDLYGIGSQERQWELLQ